MAQARRGATTRPVAREPQSGCGPLRSGCVSAHRAAGRVDRVSACCGCRTPARGSVLVWRTAVRVRPDVCRDRRRTFCSARTCRDDGHGSATSASSRPARDANGDLRTAGCRWLAGPGARPGLRLLVDRAPDRDVPGEYSRGPEAPDGRRATGDGARTQIAASAFLDRRGGPLFSRSEARLPAESRQLGSLESRRTSSSRQTAPG